MSSHYNRPVSPLSAQASPKTRSSWHQFRSPRNGC